MKKKLSIITLTVVLFICLLPSVSFAAAPDWTKNLLAGKTTPITAGPYNVSNYTVYASNYKFGDGVAGYNLLNASNNPVRVWYDFGADTSIDGWTVSWVNASTNFDSNMSIVFLGATNNVLYSASVPKGTGSTLVLIPAVSGVRKVSVHTSHTQNSATLGRIGVFMSQDLTPPGNITGLTGTPGLKRTDFSWTNPTDSDFASTKVYRDGVLVSTLGKTVASFSDSGLFDTTSYTYNFVTLDNSNNSASGVSMSLTTLTPDTTAPSNPTSFNHLVNNTSNSIDFSWLNPSDTDFYQVKLYRDGILQFSGNGTRYTDSNLVPGQVYVYKLTAIDKTGNESQGVSKSLSILGSTNPDTGGYVGGVDFDYSQLITDTSVFSYVWQNDASFYTPSSFNTFTEGLPVGMGIFFDTVGIYLMDAKLKLLGQDVSMGFSGKNYFVRFDSLITIGAWIKVLIAGWLYIQLMFFCWNSVMSIFGVHDAKGIDIHTTDTRWYEKKMNR